MPTARTLCIQPRSTSQVPKVPFASPSEWAGREQNARHKHKSQEPPPPAITGSASSVHASTETKANHIAGTPFFHKRREHLGTTHRRMRQINAKITTRNIGM